VIENHTIYVIRGVIMKN